MEDEGLEQDRSEGEVGLLKASNDILRTVKLG